MISNVKKFFDLLLIIGVTMLYLTGSIFVFLYSCLTIDSNNE